MADDLEYSVPEVSGISPNEGPPGTKITIRGENLGEKRDDVIALTLNDKSCLESLEYFSSKKLVCLSPDIVGKSHIIVTTLSGGEGTCLVYFTGLLAELKPQLDTLMESDVWIDETYNPLTPGLSTAVPERPAYMQLSAEPLGVPGAYRKGQKRNPSQANLEKLFPDCSGNLLSPKFNPKWFLVEKHRSTSFSDLKRGLVQLGHELDRSEEAPVLFMRDNLLTFLQSYDTLSDVNELLIRNESESSGGSLTDTVEELLKDAATHAEEVFEGIIKCKMRADTTRNGLTVLQRYRFLFNLPRSIEKNITNGEYDLVTTDYERAKSLFASTQVKVFKKVMDEVEKQIRGFRHNLRRKLQVLPSSLEEQKRIIKYLLELDCDGEPAWECITNVHQWLLKLLFTSKSNHQNPDRPLKGPRELSSLPASLVIAQDIPPDLPPRRGTIYTDEESNHSRTMSTMSDVSFASNTSYGSVPPPVPPSPLRSLQVNPSSSGRGSDISGRPMNILFVEEITDIVCETLPDLWRLGRAYFSGSLFQGVMLTEKQQQLATNCGVNQARFESMILEIVEVYTDMVNCSLFDDAYEQLSQKRKERLGEWNKFNDPLEKSGDWLPQIVRQIRECVGSLQGLSLPEKAVTITTQLAFNVRTLCADTLFERTARDIKELHNREDWRVQAEVGGIVTSLPVLFENMVVEVLIALKEIVVDSHSEVMDHLNQELLDTSRQHFLALIEHFISCFDYLAFHNLEKSTSMITEGQNVAGTNEEAEEVTPTSDEQLLTILSNLHYMMEEVIPRLFHCFVSHGYPPAELVRETVMEQLYKLDEKIFSEYITRKSESVTGIIEEGMKAGFFDWERCPVPKTVRNYVKEVLFNLVIIHAEVHAVSSRIVERVLLRLVELLSAEFLKLITEVESFSFQGILYAYIELASLEEVMELYLSEESLSNFGSCREYLSEWDVEADDNVHKAVDAFKERTKLQLRCFRMVANNTTPEMEDSGEFCQPEVTPKKEEPIFKPREPSKVEVKPPKEQFKTRREERSVADEFKKVKKYKPMPEGFD